MLPNIAVVFRIFLTMCVSVASCERRFSKLKLVKNYLHSQKSDVRLSGLAVLSATACKTRTRQKIGIASVNDYDDIVRNMQRLAPTPIELSS